MSEQMRGGDGTYDWTCDETYDRARPEADNATRVRKDSQPQAQLKRRGASGRGVVVLSAALLLLSGTGATEAQAAEAWVRGGINLNLRTEPGTKYRIITKVSTGDWVNVLEHGEKWTKVALKGGDQGWIPAGYLQEEPPAELRVSQLEKANQELHDKAASLEEELASLREASDGYETERSTQEAEIRRLSTENGRLEAGARYPELIAGASILALGMIAGALMRSGSSRRQPSRIRL